MPLKIFPFTGLLLLIALTAFSSEKLNRSLKPARPAAETMLYLPSGESLELISFGYRNILADILWFNTINYFGKHYKSDRNYKWMGHMCGLVTRLDPKASHVYEFCGLMLAWESELPEESVAILTRAIKNFPESWKFLYLRGITRLFFLKETELASQDLIEAAKLPGAHPVLIKLASKKLSELSDIDTALSFLQERIENSSDGPEKQALMKRYRKLAKQRDKEKSNEQ